MLNSKYRSDIDGLRAVAILAVVLFHAFPEIFKGGFIGVDIFFVISGYLISNILFEELKEKNFSFISFYFRRIKRIFPSLIAVLIFIYALGWFVLYPPEYAELGKHMMAGGAFFANFSFWQEAGYFDQKTTLKPLLHLWSLSVEEQFYIIWPCLLFLMWRIRKISLWLIIIFLGISFATNLYLTLHAPQAAFYLPFGRFWELIVGAGLAYTTQFMPEKFKFFDRHSQIIGLVAILILGFGFFVIDQDRFFPGAWAIIPTLGATLLILSGQHSYVGQKILSHPMLVKIGLISYPLYLWHWPLFSFAFILFGFEIPSTIKILIIFVSILLAWLCYILLEKPIRKQGYKTSISLLVIMIFVVISGHSVYVREGLEFRIKKILDVYGGRPPANDPDCLVKFSNYGPIFCRLSDPVKPTKTVILGDSVAHNTYPGIANRFELTPESLVMMGWPGVAPFLKIITDGKEADPNTVKMNRLIQGITQDKNIVRVILTMNQPTELTEAYIQQMIKTIELLKSGSKQLIYVMAPPPLSFEPIECVGMPPFRPVKNENCRQDISQFPQSYFLNRIKIQTVMQKHGVAIFDTYGIICNATHCDLKAQDDILYRTRKYLSTVGSLHVFKDFPM